MPRTLLKFTTAVLLPASFIVLAVLAFKLVPSIEIGIIIALLLLAIYLFVSEVIPVDTAAISIMILLGFWSWLGPALGLSEPLIGADKLFDGFSSNAVISIIAVMIIGASLDKTGVMTVIAGAISRIGSSAEKKIIPLTAGAAGIISSFMQNVGAAALFIPVVSRISARTNIPLSRLLMPMGFCAICGGTLTMVGSSPLILVNDLILSSNQGLAPDQQMQTFSLFAVTPIGLAILASSVLYFVVAGRWVLPTVRVASTEGVGTIEYIRDMYNIHHALYEVRVPAESSAVGLPVGEIESRYALRIVALRDARSVRLGPGGLSGDTTIEAGYALAVMAPPHTVERFSEAYQVTIEPQLRAFSSHLTQTHSGVAEIVIPHASTYINKTIRESLMRKQHGLTVLTIHRRGEDLTEGVIDMPMQSGDTLVCHTSWENLQQVERDRNFVVVTTEYPKEELRPQKVWHALAFFLVSMGLVIFTDMRLSVALMCGALGMVLSGVLRIDEAYNAVSWKTVFLLASLLPLGLAVETTGTAAWIANTILTLMGGVSTWALLCALAVLSTAFSLVMSNVGATVLLVPLAVNIAVGAGGDPALFAITVTLAASNSFLIPTHQVNALIIGPGGYRVKDFLRAGGAMTVIFLVVMLAMVNLVF